MANSSVLLPAITRRRVYIATPLHLTSGSYLWDAETIGIQRSPLCVEAMFQSSSIGPQVYSKF